MLKTFDFCAHKNHMSFSDNTLPHVFQFSEENSKQEADLEAFVKKKEKNQFSMFAGWTAVYDNGWCWQLAALA